MRLLGFDISRTKAGPTTLSPVAESRGWYTILEPFVGAWQRNIKVNRDNVLSNPANFACKTLIASDIAKLRVKLVAKDSNGIWKEVDNAAYSPVLRKPNHFQTRNQFWESWILSKLSSGNTYALKGRDNRGGQGTGNVKALYILDPGLVTPLVSDEGSVFYQLNQDNLSGLTESVIVPASEIIHDRYNCLFHPLVGLSPIFANGVAATKALNIQNSSARFFGNRSMPSGILTAPGVISEDTAKRLKDNWEKNYTGDNVGKVAVLGDDLKFLSIATTAEDSQLIEQLKWADTVVCSTYHVPPYKVGIGQMPTVSNVQALNLEYYSQALQRLIEDAEECLDAGLGIGYGENLGVEFDTDNLLRMDSVTQMEVIDKGKNTFTPDEARARINLGPTPGGNVVYRQQQDFSLAALAKRDAQDDPFKTDSGALALPPPAKPEDDASDDEARGLIAATLLRKELGLYRDAA
ncbi:phage portal protein [Tardiphaga sp. 37S4]|uniref:phage portal protein n=1 Tax=Tardiphaga sp. 37S4 TaxID=1404741 RepID=UPI001E4E2289|nr:phage portal protein [Tardiphaga sp. 37S4]UFS77213.1 phage portal protein [Tardiphaga sp. 37S4]